MKRLQQEDAWNLKRVHLCLWKLIEGGSFLFGCLAFLVFLLRAAGFPRQTKQQTKQETANSF